MAALGNIVINTSIPVVVEYAPNAYVMDLGSMSISVPDGYLYSPPDEGQVWPRGDYAPLG